MKECHFEQIALFLNSPPTWALSSYTGNNVISKDYGKSVKQKKYRSAHSYNQGHRMEYGSVPSSLKRCAGLHEIKNLTKANVREVTIKQQQNVSQLEKGYLCTKSSNVIDAKSLGEVLACRSFFTLTLPSYLHPTPLTFINSSLNFSFPGKAKPVRQKTSTSAVK